MLLLYNLGIRIFNLFIVFVSLFNDKAKLWVKGRKKIINKIKSSINQKDNIIWFHASSLGEFEQGRPIIEQIKQRHKEYKILLTFFSPSGYEIMKDYEFADYIFYLPLDTKKNTQEFIKTINPQIAIFIKYEFWFNYLYQLQKNNIPTYLISAIFRKNQLFFKWYGKWYKKMLRYFTHLFVQNQESQTLLSSIQVNNVTVTGDTRFDRVYDISKQSSNLTLIEKFKQNKLILIAGSTWEKDEELLIKYINSTTKDLKFIIAPHEVKKENINRIIKQLNCSVVRYTQANESTVIKAKVMLIDCIGILSSAYKYANIAYIGGAFGKGLHNVLEAATFGMPILFGPNYKKFNEACELVKRKSAFPITNFLEMKTKFDEIIEDQSYLEKLGNISANFVKENLGSSSKIIEKLPL